MTWAPDYITSALLKSYLNIQHDNDDVWLGNWITTVSRNVDDFCGRQFGQVATPEVRYYKANWDRHDTKSVIEIDDLQTTTGFAVADSNGTTITNYTLEPRNALLKGLTYTRITIPTYYSYDLTITGRWGWTAVPLAVPTAMYLQAARLSARRGSPFGIAGSPQEGSELRLLAQLDPDFKTSLKPYVRKWYVR